MTTDALPDTMSIAHTLKHNPTNAMHTCVHHVCVEHVHKVSFRPFVAIVMLVPEVSFVAMTSANYPKASCMDAADSLLKGCLGVQGAQILPTNKLHQATGLLT